MKKALFTICLIFPAAFALAQNGLENIIVEKYYITNDNDTAANPDGGILPVRSVTYRIFVDMLQGYEFQAAYGVPGHELRLSTSTAFFNNIDRGATYPNYTKLQARANTVMIDSWLTVGAGCVGNFGVLKSEDDGVSTVVNNYVPQVLQNADATAGIPLSQEDGLLVGTPQGTTFIGFTIPELALLDNTTDSSVPNIISTWNASWASLIGSVGPDTTNKVLIAQITTDGTFCFKLNIQVRQTGGGAVERFVADSAVGAEVVMSSLSQCFLGIPSGVQSVNSSLATMEIFPNPISESLSVQISTLNLTHANKLTVLDMQGKAIYEKELGTISGSRMEKMDLTALARGPYILQLTSDGVTSGKLFIKN